MGQNESSPSHTYSTATQAEIIKVLAEENREKDEVIKRQRNIILKEKQEEAAEILRLKKEILEKKNQSAVKALEEKSLAKQKAIIEKERVVREKERQLKEQERIIQIQKEELEKHKQITKNVLETVVQKQAEKPPKRFNHQYKFNDQPAAPNVETKLHNMQISEKNPSASNQNKPKKFNKSNDVRHEPNGHIYGHNNVLYEPESGPSGYFGHQQMFNHPSNFYPKPMARYPLFAESLGQTVNPSLLENNPRFINFNVPPPNLLNLNQQSTTNMHLNNQNSKENPSRGNEVFPKSDSSKKTMIDDKYTKTNPAEGSGKKDEKHDSEKNSTTDNSNKTRRHRRYGRNKAHADQNSKAEQLDGNVKNSDKRMIGQFQCPKCLKSWKSATTYIGFTQQCAKCRIDVFPAKLESMNKHREDLCGKCKELGRSCREIPVNKSTNVPREKETIDELIYRRRSRL